MPIKLAIKAARGVTDKLVSEQGCRLAERTVAEMLGRVGELARLAASAPAAAAARPTAARHPPALQDAATAVGDDSYFERSQGEKFIPKLPAVLANAGKKLVGKGPKLSPEERAAWKARAAAAQEQRRAAGAAAKADEERRKREEDADKDRRKAEEDRDKDRRKVEEDREKWEEEQDKRRREAAGRRH